MQTNSDPAVLAARAAVQEAVLSLEITQRNIFFRKYVCSESIEQTCAEMGITEARYQELVDDGLRALRQLVKPVLSVKSA